LGAAATCAARSPRSCFVYGSDEFSARAAAHSRKTYPHTPLRLYVEALGGGHQTGSRSPMQHRRRRLAALVPDELRSEPLLDVPLVTVVSPSHPLAKSRRAGLGISHWQTRTTGPHRPHRAH